MQKQYDYIIQGAGASGLWLAYWMQELGLLKSHHLLVIEGIETKGNDRTWCFWTPENVKEFPFVNRHWSSLMIRGNAQRIDPFQYCHARSESFYGWVKAKLAGNAHVHWSSEWVRAATQEGSQVSVVTDACRYQSQYFFRSGQMDEGQENTTIALWQSFVGWRIKFRQGGWDDGAATLMDFSIPQAGTTRFLYVLPISETEGLVEVTQFYSEKLARSEGEAILEHVCAERNWAYDVEEVECDAIPMSSFFNQKQSHNTSGNRIISIGVYAGALKPTTGYGFLAMREHGRSLALALQQKQLLPKIFRKARFRFYDALLLQMLTHTPYRGKAIFERLFSKQPAHRVLKFLDEKTSIWEEIRIFSRLQVSWFLKALVTHVRS